MAETLPAGLKVAVLNDRADIFAKLIQAKFPGFQPILCNDAKAFPDLIAREKPSVAMTVKWGTMDFPRDALKATPSVRWVQLGSAGIDDMVPWDATKLTVTNASGVYSDVLAEYAIGAMIMLNLGFLDFREQQQRRFWKNRHLPLVQGKTVLVVGLGRIGEAVAARAKALGLRVIGVRTKPAQSPNAERVVGIDDLKSVLPAADFVVLAIPRTPRTIGLFDPAMIAKFKKGAYLVNVARGRIMDEPALIAALKSGAIAGAAIDVFATEPLPKESEFWGLHNVLVTPHTGDPEDSRERIAALFTDNLARFARGEPLRNVVTPERGY